jgi:hypothetical protein
VKAYAPRKMRDNNRKTMTVSKRDACGCWRERNIGSRYAGWPDDELRDLRAAFGGERMTELQHFCEKHWKERG